MIVAKNPHDIDIDTSKPNTFAVLVLLDRAGKDGMQAGELAHRFDSPLPFMDRDGTRYRNPRNVWVNNILAHMREYGFAVRSEKKEPSTVYNNVPVYRWTITDEGRTRITLGPWQDFAQVREARREESRRRREENVRVRREALEQAYADDWGPWTPWHARRAKILELRRVPLSLEEIGILFGVSREMIRIVEAYPHKVPACHCEECEPPEVFPTVQ